MPMGLKGAEAPRQEAPTLLGGLMSTEVIALRRHPLQSSRTSITPSLGSLERQGHSRWPVDPAALGGAGSRLLSCQVWNCLEAHFSDCNLGRVAASKAWPWALWQPGLWA